MTQFSLERFHRTDDTVPVLRQLDVVMVTNRLKGESEPIADSALAKLRLAAISATASLLDSRSIDDWVGESARIPSVGIDGAAWCHRCCDGYLDALVERGARPSVDDVLSLIVAGTLSSRPHESRDSIRKHASEDWLQWAIGNADSESWPRRVRDYISIALIVTFRQENRSDIELAGRLLRDLAAMQSDIESAWLDKQSLQSEYSLRLLAQYHAAEAVIRLSEFLLSGAVQEGDRLQTDIQAELRRLMIRANEFLSVARASEEILWLKSTAVILIALRSASIWVQARGISAKIDEFVNSLVQAGRTHQVFNLLPSQQDALRQSLLDPSRVAVVLQMPTSAGKTLLAEFSILQTVGAFPNGARVVYLVPTRALATQARRTLAMDLGPLGIKCSAAGSAFEEDPFELHMLNNTDGVVVSTPEKLDLMLRSHPNWFEDLKLVVVDEAHLLNDGERGARLELLLANLRREAPDARLLLLTPFVENAHEIASWLSPERSHSVSVQWRPSNVLLGAAELKGRRGDWRFKIDLQDPYRDEDASFSLSIPTGLRKVDLSSARDRVAFLGDKFRELGTVLSLFSASRSDAEQSARDFANQGEDVTPEEQASELSLAIGLAKHEYGVESDLAYCLSRGSAFHHSSVSPVLRYLIESCVREKSLHYVAATSTLAQGMNFPVATVLVHSVHKPHGGGDMSGSEFWNLAGRAGRVGLVDRGFVVFANEKHIDKMNHYSKTLSSQLGSALLAILPRVDPTQPLKEQYRTIPELRPFIQYLAHSAATQSPERAIANLEELIQQSLANELATSDNEKLILRTVGRQYLQQLLTTTGGMLKAADQTGLSTFSFNSLYAQVRDSELLQEGPSKLRQEGRSGYAELIEALRWLPELNLAIGYGEGDMDVGMVARVVDEWVQGRQIHELAPLFPGNDQASQLRAAASYLYGTVSQTVSWGTHAYLRGWLLNRADDTDVSVEDRMLPAYIQYGVNTPEAAVASLLGVPRPFATSFGQIYRDTNGALTPENVEDFRHFTETADVPLWTRVVQLSGVQNVSASDLRRVVADMQGLTAEV